MDDLEDFVMRRPPTATRPLMGMTVLVVEDSRYACEAIRLMCLRSGARIRRADCLRSAARHLRIYRPEIAVIDIGLPDGSGLDLIGELAAGHPRVAVVIGTSGDSGAEDAVLAAGADGFLAKPVASLAAFQEGILRHLPPDMRPQGPRSVSSETLAPDPIAMRDDLAHVQDLLDGRADGATLDYVAQFLGGLAISASDKPMLSAARALGESRRGFGEASPALDTLNALIRRRMAETGVV